MVGRQAPVNRGGGAVRPRVACIREMGQPWIDNWLSSRASSARHFAGVRTVRPNQGQGSRNAAALARARSPAIARRRGLGRGVLVILDQAVMHSSHQCLCPVS